MFSYSNYFSSDKLVFTWSDEVANGLKKSYFSRSEYMGKWSMEIGEKRIMNIIHKLKAGDLKRSKPAIIILPAP